MRLALTATGGMAKMGLVGTRSGLNKTGLSDCTMVIQHHLKTSCPITIGQRINYRTEPGSRLGVAGSDTSHPSI